jgi:hypothetical protein
LVIKLIETDKYESETAANEFSLHHRLHANQHRNDVTTALSIIETNSLKCMMNGSAISAANALNMYAAVWPWKIAFNARTYEYL